MASRRRPRPGQKNGELHAGGGVVVKEWGGGGIGDLKKTFSTDYEIALVFNRGNPLKGKRIGSVWKIGKDNATDYKHPTQKPVELAKEAIEKTSDINDIVLDLFAGSGSTLIACEKIKRKCYTMEFDPRYVDVIIQRWQNFTGKEAIGSSNSNFPIFIEVILPK